MKAQRGSLYSFFNLGTRWLGGGGGGRGGGCQQHASATLLPGKRPGTHCTGGWVGPTASLKGWGNLIPTRIWSPNCPSCCNWLYYPSPLLCEVQTEFLYTVQITFSLSKVKDHYYFVYTEIIQSLPSGFLSNLPLDIPSPWCVLHALLTSSSLIWSPPIIFDEKHRYGTLNFSNCTILLLFTVFNIKKIFPAACSHILPVSSSLHMRHHTKQ